MKYFKLYLIAFVLIPFKMQGQSCSACMGFSQERPDEIIEVLIRYNEREEPVFEQAARYGETIVYGGDVVLTNNYSDEIALRGTIISDLSRLWTNSTIPYVFDTGLPQSTRTVILNAIESINTQTNLCVVERTGETDFIRFQDTENGCYVLGVGNVGGNQLVNLGGGCVYESVIIHEILHKAGFYHEQTRPDRDNYITVNWNNLAPGWASQFTAQGGEQAAGNYDFASIMHYPQYHPSLTIDDSQPAFFINSGVTVPPGVNIGNMPNMSTGDIAAVNQLYLNTCNDNSNCPPAWNLSQVNLGGIYQAENTVTSTATISPNLSAVIFKAGDYVSLEPGFWANGNNGYYFQATIEECSNSLNAPANDLTQKPADISYDYIKDNQTEIPEQMTAELSTPFAIKNYPNPFTGQTTIEFVLPEDSPVTLFVSDMNGRKIATLLDNEAQLKGIHQVIFDGSNYPAGMYYYTIQAGEQVSTQKMILTK